VEVGRKKVFAVAVDWLGLARWAKTDDEALDALVTYAPRFKKSIGSAARALRQPKSVDSFEIVDRLGGNTTTDFGAPSAIIDGDRRRLTDAELDDAIRHLRAAWKAFVKAAEKARGQSLAPSGPRGGGRSLKKMVEHVRGADEGYASAVGKSTPEGGDWSVVQENFIAAIRARNAGELPDVGPRGGERWPALFAMRRSAWHALDHAWELEDRAARVG